MTSKYLKAAGGLLLCSLVGSGCGPQEELSIATQASALTTVSEQHCVVPLVAAKPGGSPDATSRQALGQSCFPSLHDAISFATNGSADISPDDSISELIAAVGKAGKSDLASTYVIGIEFEHANYGGSSLTFTANGTCHNYSFLTNAMPPGWNDVISSSVAYSGCSHAIHYEHNNQGGAAIDAGTVSSYIGPAMNDRTSSILWYR